MRIEDAWFAWYVVIFYVYLTVKAPNIKIIKLITTFLESLTLKHEIFTF